MIRLSEVILPDRKNLPPFTGVLDRSKNNDCRLPFHRWVEKKLRDLLTRLEQRGTPERSLRTSESSAGKQSDQISSRRDRGKLEKRIDKSDQTMPSGKRENITGEMSKEKAASILEDYRIEEEAGMKAKESRRKGYEPEVQKDW